LFRPDRDRYPVTVVFVMLVLIVFVRVVFAHVRVFNGSLILSRGSVSH
jgi:hypothetical protein